MTKPKGKWAELPKIEGELRTAAPTTEVSPEMLKWAEDLRERNRAALEELYGAVAKQRGDCPQCARKGVLLHAEEPTDPDPRLVCAECARAFAKRYNHGRVQLCDKNPDHGQAWRNPYTRRNEYLCGSCHAESGEGVVQNKWARVSDPINRARRPVCAVKGQPGFKPCRGEVKPRGTNAVDLCNEHAGKTSAEYAYSDRFVGGE